MYIVVLFSLKSTSLSPVILIGVAPHTPCHSFKIPSILLAYTFMFFLCFIFLSAFLFYQRGKHIYTCNICDSILTRSTILIVSSQIKGSDKGVLPKASCRKWRSPPCRDCLPSMTTIHSLTKRYSFAHRGMIFKVQVLQNHVTWSAWYDAMQFCFCNVLLIYPSQ